MMKEANFTANVAANGREAYMAVEKYLAARIIGQKPQDQQGREEWSELLFQAHHQYGTAKSELIARVW